MTMGTVFPVALTLPPAAGAQGMIKLPGSKSISNRSLLLAALADGTTMLDNLLDADDVDLMLDALRTLGVSIERPTAAARCVVHGRAGGPPNRRAQLSLGNAGTAFRPLTAVLAMRGGDYELTGVARMHERPIGDLVAALIMLGCDVRYLGNRGYPPLAIGCAGGAAGGMVRIRGDTSSQFLSALLIALPLARGSATAATTVHVTTPLVSRPYVDITTHLMERFGVRVETPDASTFRIPAGARYASPGRLLVEGDASTASYFLAAGVIGGGPVRVEGVGRDSIQGDVQFASVLARQGADIRMRDNAIEARAGRPLTGGTFDCSAIPDAAMTLAVTALFAKAPTRLNGIGSWRVKETDRIAAMVTELKKLGARAEGGQDWLEVQPPAELRAASVDTYDDHRMAMCLSLATLAGVAVTINDPGCVRKTFPGYFDAWRRVVLPVAAP
jgi:3-phosphoshikimate 1-carboxyvinyltransferase